MSLISDQKRNFYISKNLFEISYWLITEIDLLDDFYSPIEILERENQFTEKVGEIKSLFEIATHYSRDVNKEDQQKLLILKDLVKTHINNIDIENLLTVKDEDLELTQGKDAIEEETFYIEQYVPLLDTNDPDYFLTNIILDFYKTMDVLSLYMIKVDPGMKPLENCLEMINENLIKLSNARSDKNIENYLRNDLAQFDPRNLEEIVYEVRDIWNQLFYAWKMMNQGFIESMSSSVTSENTDFYTNYMPLVMDKSIALSKIYLTLCGFNFTIGPRLLKRTQPLKIINT
jgi:hypothetical protein